MALSQAEPAEGAAQLQSRHPLLAGKEHSRQSCLRIAMLLYTARRDYKPHVMLVDNAMTFGVVSLCDYDVI